MFPATHIQGQDGSRVFGLARSGTRLRRSAAAWRRRGGGLGRLRRRRATKAKAAGLPVGDLDADRFRRRSTRWSVSPGVPLTHPEAALDGREGASRRHRDHRRHRSLPARDRRAPGARLVAITGTNGKSTTTALTGHLLRVGRPRCRCRRQYRHGGVPAAAAAPGPRLCARAFLLPDRPHAQPQARCRHSH